MHFVFVPAVGCPPYVLITWFLFFILILRRVHIELYIYIAYKNSEYSFNIRKLVFWNHCVDASAVLRGRRVYPSTQLPDSSDKKFIEQYFSKIFSICLRALEISKYMETFCTYTLCQSFMERLKTLWKKNCQPYSYKIVFIL